MIGCHCAVCRSDDPRDKRTRCSVVIRHAGISVLVDTTPELRLQCVANGIDSVDAVVFTHGHADHVCGLDDCRRFNAIRGGPLDVWADQATHASLGSMFPYAFTKPGDGELRLFRPALVPRLIDGPFHIGQMTWTPVRYPHSNVPALGFRVSVGDGRDIAYCTDCNAVPAEARELLRGLDTLVIDALQPRKHPTHLTIEEALEVVADLQPRQTFFTHMSHEVCHAIEEAKLPPNVRFAYDGLRTDEVRETASHDADRCFHGRGRRAARG